MAGGPGEHVFGNREDPVAGDPREDASGSEPSLMGLSKAQVAALMDILESVDFGQVTEDDPAAANPTGGPLIARRRDTLTTAEVTADGDQIALNATSKGQLHTYDADVLAAVDGLETKLDTLITSLGTQGPVAAGTLTSVNSLATSAQLLAANTARKGVIIRNTDANSLYVHYGTTATADAAVEIPTGAMWEMPSPIYTGRIDGIWAADGSGAAKILEL